MFFPKTKTNNYSYICIEYKYILNIMAKIYLLENIERNLKECYSNLKKVSSVYPVSYWGLYAAIKNKNVYRKDGYIVTKMIVK